MVPCGPQNNFYSAAGTGMGLVTEAIMVELGQSKIMVRGHLAFHIQVIRQERRPQLGWFRH